MTPGDTTAVGGFRHFHDQLTHLKQRLLEMSDLATSLLDRAVDWSSKLSEADWSKIISYKDSRGSAHQTALLPIVMHLVNHGSYHRGQVSQLLRQSGVTPPATDLIMFYRQAFAQKA